LFSCGGVSIIGWSDIWHDIVGGASEAFYVSINFAFDSDSGGYSVSGYNASALGSSGYHYDAHEQAYSRTINGANGTHIVDVLDLNNHATWTSKEAVFDSAWRPLSDSGILDTLDSWSTGYINGKQSVQIFTDGGVNDHTWFKYSYLKDFFGGNYQENSLNDDGTSYMIQRDLALAKDYSVIQTYYGTNGLITSQYGTYDTHDIGDTWASSFTNGVQRSITYTDLGQNDKTWYTYTYSYNAFGEQTTARAVNDDGTSVVTQTDPRNEVSYQLLTSYYGVNGLLTTQYGTQDTGDTWASSFVNGTLRSITYSDTGPDDHTWRTYNTDPHNH
jgi:hypothetical protein